MRISRMLPSRIPSPPAPLMLRVCNAIVRAGAFPGASIGDIIRHDAWAHDGVCSLTPDMVRRAVALLVALRAVRWGTDGRLTVLDAECIARECERVTPKPIKRNRRKRVTA